MTSLFSPFFFPHQRLWTSASRIRLEHDSRLYTFQSIRNGRSLRRGGPGWWQIALGSSAKQMKAACILRFDYAQTWKTATGKRKDNDFIIFFFFRASGPGDDWCCVGLGHATAASHPDWMDQSSIRLREWRKRDFVLVVFFSLFLHPPPPPYLFFLPSQVFTFVICTNLDGGPRWESFRTRGRKTTTGGKKMKEGIIKASKQLNKILEIQSVITAMRALEPFPDIKRERCELLSFFFPLSLYFYFQLGREAAKLISVTCTLTSWNHLLLLESRRQKRRGAWCMTAFRRGKKIPNISERNERRRRRRQRRERKQLSRFLKSFPTRWFFVSLARFPPFHTQQHKTEPSLHSSLFLQFSILFLYSFYGLKKRRKISRDLSLRSGSSLLFSPVL